MASRLSLASIPFLLTPAVAEAGGLHRGAYPNVPEGPRPEEPVTDEGKAILAEVSTCLKDPEQQTGVSLFLIAEDKRVQTQIGTRDAIVDEATWNCVMDVAEQHGFFNSDHDDRYVSHPLGDNSVQFFNFRETLSDEDFATAKAAYDAQKALPYKRAERSSGYGAEGPLPGMQFGAEYLVQPKKPSTSSWAGNWPATYEQIGFMAQQTKRNGRGFGPSDDLVTDEIRVPFSPENTIETKHGVIATAEGSFKDGTTVKFQTIACEGGDVLNIAEVTPSMTFPIATKERKSAPGFGYFSGVQDLIYNHAATGKGLLPQWEAALFCATEGDDEKERARAEKRREKLYAKEVAAE